jgi:micrococcal nuclease
VITGTMTRALFIVAWAVSLAYAGFSAAHAAEVEVISGDVIRLPPDEWRIANIDAPQIENTCDGEAKLGVLAQAKLAEFLAQGEMEIRPTGQFDLHHRKMALVRINGEDVGEKMLAAGLAQRYGQARPLCAAGQPRRTRRPKEPLSVPATIMPPYAPPSNQPRPVR